MTKINAWIRDVVNSKTITPTQPAPAPAKPANAQAGAGAGAATEPTLTQRLNAAIRDACLLR